MDSFPYVILCVFPLILALLGFLGNKPGWAVFPLFGAVIGAIGCLALYSDGNLTNAGVTIAAANGNFVSDFNFIEAVPVTIALTALVVGIRRIFNI